MDDPTKCNNDGSTTSTFLLLFLALPASLELCLYFASTLVDRDLLVVLLAVGAKINWGINWLFIWWLDKESVSDGCIESALPLQGVQFFSFLWLSMTLALTAYRDGLSWASQMFFASMSVIIGWGAVHFRFITPIDCVYSVWLGYAVAVFWHLFVVFCIRPNADKIVGSEFGRFFHLQNKYVK